MQGNCINHDYVFGNGDSREFNPNLFLSLIKFMSSEFLSMTSLFSSN